MCGKGKMQSPIDLTDKRVLIDHNLGYLRSHYLPSNATIKNRGHDIMVKSILAFSIYLHFLIIMFFFCFVNVAVEI